MIGIAGNEYVLPRGGNVYIGDTRMTLDSIVLSWRGGETSQSIHEGFPTVRLAAIYGTIAYYLDHQAEVDAYLNELDELERIGRAESEAANPEFYTNMRKRLGMDPLSPSSDEAATDTTAGSPTP